MAGDLHTHSPCSDGSVPIHRLPLMAARLGLSALALSDHDTILIANRESHEAAVFTVTEG